MPKVSVIIPVYGVEKYIERCARSLFEQTLDDIEYIFVDDCTPDHSMEILKSIIGEYRLRFAEEKKVVRIERMPTNSGLPAVRRHGIQLATGDYIIHCDSDDWTDTDMYRAMYEQAVKDGADVVVCDYYAASQDVQIQNKGAYGISRNQIISDILTDKIAGCVWNKMFARSLYKETMVFPVGNMAEDVVLSVQLLLNSTIVSYVPKPLYYYFCNSGSITQSHSKEKAKKNFFSAINNAKIVIKNINERGLAELFKREIEYFKYREKSFLFPYLKENEIKRLWINTFPEINIRIIFSPYLPFKRKVKYVLLLVKSIVRQ